MAKGFKVVTTPPDEETKKSNDFDIEKAKV